MPFVQVNTGGFFDVYLRPLYFRRSEYSDDKQPAKLARLAEQTQALCAAISITSAKGFLFSQTAFVFARAFEVNLGSAVPRPPVKHSQRIKHWTLWLNPLFSGMWFLDWVYQVQTAWITRATVLASFSSTASLIIQPFKLILPETTPINYWLIATE